MLPHPGCQTGVKLALGRLDTQKKPVVAFHPLQSEPKRFAFSLVIHFPGLIPARETGGQSTLGVIAEANNGIHSLSQRLNLVLFRIALNATASADRRLQSP